MSQFEFFIAILGPPAVISKGVNEPAFSGMLHVPPLARNGQISGRVDLRNLMFRTQGPLSLSGVENCAAGNSGLPILESANYLLSLIQTDPSPCSDQIR